MGEASQGIIMYTPDGFMSAQLCGAGRANFVSGDWFDGTPKVSKRGEESNGKDRWYLSGAVA